MDALVRSQFIEHDILNRAIDLYGIDKDSITPITGYENHNFKVMKGRQQCILRVSHSNKRTSDEILGELDFINYLHASGMGVPNILKSINGSNAEIIDADHGEFTCCLFEFCAGSNPTDNDLTPMMYERMGAYLGRFHNLSSGYTPNDYRLTLEEDLQVLAKRYFSRGDEFIMEKIDQLHRELTNLSHDHTLYGLNHNDFHPGNFNIDGDTIYLYDFDDCVYAPFINDIAVSLTHAINPEDPFEKRQKVGHDFLTSFLKGYRSVRDFDQSHMRYIQHFIELRMIVIFFAMCRNAQIDPGNQELPETVEKIREALRHGYILFCPDKSI